MMDEQNESFREIINVMFIINEQFKIAHTKFLKNIVFFKINK